MSINAEMFEAMAEDSALREEARRFFERTYAYKYCYNWTWMDRPIIQYPEDILASQEIILRTKPDLIIETGIAHGGSIIFSASMLELLGGGGEVVGIDIDIRPHNRRAIEQHPMSRRIRMIEGSSTSPEVAEVVRAAAEGRQRVMVMLDSNHTHQHVKEELALYAPLVTQGCYLIVYDTVIEYLPPDSFSDRPWSIGDNPATAVREFLSQTDRFVVDQELERKLLLSQAPGGYLRCVKS